MKVIRIGGLYDRNGKKHQMGSVYDPLGLAPPLDTCGGGYRMPMIVMKDESDEGNADRDGQNNR